MSKHILTENMKKELRDLFARFTYAFDPEIDHWAINKGDGKFEGDCEDFALTLLYNLSGRSMKRMWWNIITMKAVIWQVTAENGEGHAVLWYQGYWADNMEPVWYRTEVMRHTRRYPYLAPMLLAKFCVAAVSRK